MSVESSGNAKEIFLAAIELASSNEREAFLNGACGEDNALRDRVEALIVAHESPASLLNHAAPKLEAALLPEADRQLADNDQCPDGIVSAGGHRAERIRFARIPDSVAV